jgi:hypothetical protein
MDYYVTVSQAVSQLSAPILSQALASGIAARTDGSIGSRGHSHVPVMCLPIAVKRSGCWNAGRTRHYLDDSTARAPVGKAMTAFYLAMFVLPAAIVATAIVLARVLRRRVR